MSADLETIVLPDGAPALLAGARTSTPGLRQRLRADWPATTQSECAAAFGARLERLAALDDLLHWRELGAEVLIAANIGALLNEPGHFQAGEPNALVEIAGAAATPDSGVLIGCFVSTADDEACRFVGAAALRAAWLDVGGWAIVRAPTNVRI